MSKLTIGHLSAYLPYNLNLIFEKSGRVITMLSCFNDGCLQIIDVGEGNNYNLSVWNFKPILIPLEKFKDINSPEMMELNIDLGDTLLLSELANERIGYWDIPYGLARICFRSHIDIYNLIPQGLAVKK